MKKLSFAVVAALVGVLVPAVSAFAGSSTIPGLQPLIPQAVTPPPAAFPIVPNIRPVTLTGSTPLSIVIVPEPATWAMLAVAGLALAAFVGYRKLAAAKA
jgi:hypothetical protein